MLLGSLSHTSVAISPSKNLKESLNLYTLHDLLINHSIEYVIYSTLSPSNARCNGANCMSAGETVVPERTQVPKSHLASGP
jgi:hypothetical protein